ncbi:MAG TPA: GNAT family N-acetyltransferase [Longimicrobium sp.]|nr:GNAT family N-acetyltransferase [Longimicrobium sp.]
MPLRVERLEDAVPYSFDCGRDEQNQHLHERAFHDQEQQLSMTYLLQQDGLTAGYVTVCMDALPLTRAERGPEIRYQHVGALKLAQLGIDTRYQGRGFGTTAVRTVVRLAQRVGDIAGCRYITVDAQPDLVEWYANQGFKRNELRQSQRIAEAVRYGRDPSRIPVSMRFDIRDYLA